MVFKDGLSSLQSLHLLGEKWSDSANVGKAQSKELLTDANGKGECRDLGAKEVTEHGPRHLNSTEDRHGPNSLVARFYTL